MTMLGVVVLFGLAIGSFLNVVIVRLPVGQSLWAPRSACPRCGEVIAWYDNVPLLSFALLRARCRRCRGPISWRYPAVEAVTGGLWGLAWTTFGPTPDFVVAGVFASALLVVAVIDLDHQIIPDAITLPGICAGLLANLATGRVPWSDAGLGAVLGGAIFLAIILASGGGMGGGDMKLGAMLGAFLGWRVMLLSLFLAVVAGGLVAAVLLASRARGRKDPIPFGPFLASAGLVGLFLGERFLGWYLDAFVG